MGSPGNFISETTTVAGGTMERASCRTGLSCRSARFFRSSACALCLCSGGDGRGGCVSTAATTSAPALIDARSVVRFLTCGRHETTAADHLQFPHGAVAGAVCSDDGAVERSYWRADIIFKHTHRRVREVKSAPGSRAYPPGDYPYKFST